MTTEATPQEMQDVLDALIIRAGVPRRFHGGFHTYDAARAPECAALLEGAREFAESFTIETDRGLALTGVTGAGKTHLACGIARRLVERGFKPVFVNCATLFANIRASWDKGENEMDILNELRGADLLVLDDLGVNPGKPWVLDRLYYLLNVMHEDERPLVFTSNYAGRELIARFVGLSEDADLGDRIASRLIGMVSNIGKFPECDFRMASWRARKEAGAQTATSSAA